MRVIDGNGRLFGKISLIDVLVIIFVIGLAAGLFYKNISGDIQQIIKADKKFYVTFKGELVRRFSVDAVSEGDIFYQKYDTQALGPVVGITVKPAREIMLKPDGTAVYAEIIDRYALYITVECTGSITESGFYAYGALHMAEGGEMIIQSNKLLVISEIYRVSETFDAPEGGPE